MIQVTPAYGRDYTTAKAAKQDWYNNKDFMISDISSNYDGKPCSIRDGVKVTIRYNRLTKLTTP